MMDMDVCDGFDDDDDDVVVVGAIAPSRLYILQASSVWRMIAAVLSKQAIDECFE